MKNYLKIIPVLFFFLAMVPQAHAAIARLGTNGVGYWSATSYPSGTTDFTMSFAPTATANSVVFCSATRGTNAAATSATFGGVTMTSVDRQFFGNRNIELFYLALGTPSGGSQTFEVKYAASAAVWFSCAVYTGASQGAVDSHNKGGAAPYPSANTLDVTTSVVASNAWLVGGYSDDNGIASAGTGTSINVNYQTAQGAWIIVDSNGTVGTGSQTLEVTEAGGVGTNMVMVVASIAPFVANSTPKSSGNIVIFGEGW